MSCALSLSLVVFLSAFSFPAFSKEKNILIGVALGSFSLLKAGKLKAARKTTKDKLKAHEMQAKSQLKAC